MHILVADDHTMIRENFRDFLKRVFDDVIVTEADSYQSVLQQLQSNPSIDLAIVDLDMPGMKGSETIKSLVADNPDLPMAVFSGSFKNSIINEVIKFGARGFIPKTEGSQTMKMAIELILNGGTYVPREALMDDPQETQTEETGAEELRALLTPRELAVVAELVKGSSNKVIARALDVQDFTIKAHLQAIFKKMDVSNRSQAIIRAMDLGIVPPESE